MGTTFDIISGISQVIANTYDGAKDENGEPIKTGLKREEEVSFTDKRVIDGFKVKIYKNKLRLNYSCEVLVSDVHDKNFESDVHQTIADVVSFLKKEYKKVTSNTLSLKQVGEPKIELMNTSRTRNWLEASCVYEIDGIKIDDTDPVKISHEDAIKNWISLGRKAKKAPNDDR